MWRELLNLVGGWGFLPMYLFSMHLLWDKSILFFYFVVGILVDALMNFVLKGFIQSPRPGVDAKEWSLAMRHGKRFLYRNGLPYDMYGMPSGHTQTWMFCTVFMICALKHSNTSLLYLLGALITMVQRVVAGHHTVEQVIVGGLIGSFMGYLFYSLATLRQRGKVTEKKDDHGPV